MISLLCLLYAIKCPIQPGDFAVRTVTAYTAEVGQTDETPCIGASGSDLCRRHAGGDRVCAANFIPLGSVLYIANVGECTVADRMAARHRERVDIFLGSDRQAALRFGKRPAFVLVLRLAR